MKTQNKKQKRKIYFGLKNCILNDAIRNNHEMSETKKKYIVSFEIKPTAREKISKTLENIFHKTICSSSLFSKLG